MHTGVMFTDSCCGCFPVVVLVAIAVGLATKTARDRENRFMNSLNPSALRAQHFAQASVVHEIPAEAVKLVDEALRCLSSSEPAACADQLHEVALNGAVEEMIAAAEASVSQATIDAGSATKIPIRAMSVRLQGLKPEGDEVAVDIRVLFGSKVGYDSETETFKVHRDQVWRARAVAERECRSCGAPIRDQHRGCEYCGAQGVSGDWKLTSAIPVARSNSPVARQPVEQTGRLITRGRDGAGYRFSATATETTGS